MLDMWRGDWETVVYATAKAAVPIFNVRWMILHGTKKKKKEEERREDVVPSSILVSIYPGTMTLARSLEPLLNSDPSAAMARVKATTPAFVDAYVATPRPPLDATSDEILMMHLMQLFSEIRGLFFSNLRVIVRHANMVPCRFVLSILVI
jgi:hypothetical protein